MSETVLGVGHLANDQQCLTPLWLRQRPNAQSQRLHSPAAVPHLPLDLRVWQPDTVITHVVMMKFTDPADTTEAVERLLAMDGHIPQLVSLQVLADDLRRDGAYDLVLTSTHDDEAGLIGYLEHPVHQDLLGWIRPRLAARAVVDAAS